MNASNQATLTLSDLVYGRRITSTPVASRQETIFNQEKGVFDKLRAGLWLFKLFFFFLQEDCFPAQAEYSYFSADFRLKIFLCIFLDYSIWHFRFRMCLYFNVFWLVLPFRKRKNFIRFSYKHVIVLYLQIYGTQNYILFQISASGLFLKFRKISQNFRPRYSYKKKSVVYNVIY